MAEMDRQPPVKMDNAQPRQASMRYQKFNWKKFFKMKKYIPHWIILIIILVSVVLITIYHKPIVEYLKPVSATIRSKSWGWIIPIVILVIISFPPLFGHEIVAVLCGLIYGLWIGFAIVAAGTFLGEVATYFAFKYVFRRKAVKLEHSDLNYASLATVTREGGFWFVFIVRLSAIPSHFTTAVFATCGVAFWIFLVATFATLPKQLVIVYLGIILEDPKNTKTTSNIVLGISFLITLIAAVYVYWKMRQVRPRLLAAAQAEYEADQAFTVVTEYSHDPNNNAGNSNSNVHVNNPNVQSPLLTTNPAKEMFHTLPSSRPVDPERQSSNDSDTYPQSHNPHETTTHPYNKFSTTTTHHNGATYEMMGDSSYASASDLEIGRADGGFNSTYQQHHQQRPQQPQSYPTELPNSRNSFETIDTHNTQLPQYQEYPSSQQQQQQYPQRYSSRPDHGDITSASTSTGGAMPYPRNSVLAGGNIQMPVMHWQQHSSSTIDLHGRPIEPRDNV